jgi:uncharacterized membrane protein
MFKFLTLILCLALGVAFFIAGLLSANVNSSNEYFRFFVASFTSVPLSFVPALILPIKQLCWLPLISIVVFAVAFILHKSIIVF